MEPFAKFVENEKSRVFDVLFESEDIPFDYLLDLATYPKTLEEKSAVAPLGPQVWGKLGCNPKFAEDGCKGAIEKAYGEIFILAKKAEGTFTRGLKRAASKSRNAKVLVDIKKIGSFVDKIMNRGKKIEGITDVLRAAILVQTPEDVDEVVKRIKKDFVVVEFEHKGKKEVVAQTYKGTGKRSSVTTTKGGDSEFGYHGSYHFLVKIEGIIAEIQVMTKRLWAFKAEAHKIYNDLRSAGDSVDKQIADAKKKLSKATFVAGNKPNRNLQRRKAGKTRK